MLKRYTYKLSFLPKSNTVGFVFNVFKQFIAYLHCIL